MDGACCESSVLFVYRFSGRGGVMGRWLAYRQGLGEGVPIALGYLPVGVTFGLLATQHGLGLAEATLASVLIFSGAAQFMLVALLAAGTPWLLALMLCLLLNARHLLYGPSIAASIPAPPGGLAVLSHGLTDEVFAVALSRLDAQQPQQRPWWMAGVESAAYGAWVSATVIGALAGDWIIRTLPLLAEALPFALPALFLILVLPYFQSGRRLGIVTTLLVAGGLSLAGYAAAAILIASVAGALVCYRGIPWISAPQR